VRNGWVPVLSVACVVLCVTSQGLALDPDKLDPAKRDSAKPGPDKSAKQIRQAGVGRMLQQLGGRDWILQAEALAFFSEHRIPEALEPCRKILTEKKIQPWVRGRALVAIARIKGPEALDEIKGYVRDPESQLRAAAAEALDTIGGKAIEASIQSLLKDKDVGVRYQALAAYAHVQGAKAWPIVEPMTKEVDLSVYTPAARALAYVANEEALGRITKMASDWDRRSKIIRGIKGVPNPKLISLLLKMQYSMSGHSNDFGAILTIFQQHKRADLLAALKSELEKGQENSVRTAAMVMIMMILDPQLGDPLRQAMAKIKDVGTIRTGLVALGSKDMDPDRYKDLFTSYLDHEDPEIRAMAIRCVAHCSTVNQFTLLKDRIADKEQIVIMAALSSLLEAPVDQAPRGQMVVYLQEPLQSEDEETRALAFKLLGQAGSEADFKPAMALLMERLKGADARRREAAAEALGKIAPEKGIGRVVRSQGYLANWMVLGTFLNDEKNTGFNKVYPPETEIDFEKKYKAKYIWVLDGRRRDAKAEIEREIEWTEAAVDQTNGKLLMAPVMPPPGALVVAYAVADFKVDTPREVILRVDGDDAFRVWLNGEKITEGVGTFVRRQPSVAESAAHKIQLKAGVNRLLVKSANIDHDWWVRLRLTDAKGLPIEVEAVIP
jgi:HEAT repeat protein